MTREVVCSRLFVVLGVVALVSGTTSVPGFLREYRVDVNRLELLEGWFIQPEPSFDRGNARSWIASEGPLRFEVKAFRCGVSAKSVLAQTIGAVSLAPAPISSLGTEADGGGSSYWFRRANIVCHVTMRAVTTTSKIDWMSWPNPTMVEHTMVNPPPLNTLKFAKAIDRQIVLAVYPFWLFVASLLGMTLVLLLRADRPSKRSNDPRPYRR